MRHEAGLQEHKPDNSITPDDVSLEKIKSNAIGAALETQEPKWDKKYKRAYHAFTRGWLINEIVRRVDKN